MPVFEERLDNCDPCRIRGCLIEGVKIDRSEQLSLAGRARGRMRSKIERAGYRNKSFRWHACELRTEIRRVFVICEARGCADNLKPFGWDLKAVAQATKE